MYSGSSLIILTFEYYNNTKILSKIDHLLNT